MSSAENEPTPPRPSVFISYASADRAAARTLRDALAAAGLDVWYDESDIGGGDAWDQKIRRQIRDCDYFMPLISATTEARKEGYFRREWRLATERTMDMADDVLFLLPVAIDDTHEAGARVPDKFLHVQWLRLPGGQPTLALHALTRRLLAGEHRPPPRLSSAATRPPMSAPVPPLLPTTQPPFTQSPFAHPPSPAPASPTDPTPPLHHTPPPMPPFPPAPERGGIGHWLKFVAEVGWWIITATWLVFSRLPRWAGILLAIFLLTLFSGRCSREPAPNRPKPPDPSASTKAERRQAIKAVAEKVAAAAQTTGADSGAKGGDIARLGLEIARTLSNDTVAHLSASNSVVLVPFALGINDEVAAKFATAVFTSCYGQLLVARPGAAAIARQPPATASDEILVAFGKNIGAEFILAAQLAPGDGPHSLAVRLLRVSDGAPAWSGDFPVEGTEPTDAAAKITGGVLALLPTKTR